MYVEPGEKVQVMHRDTGIHPNDFLNGVADEGPGALGPEQLMDADNAIQRMRVSDTAAVGRTRFDIIPESPSTS